MALPIDLWTQICFQAHPVALLVVAIRVCMRGQASFVHRFRFVLGSGFRPPAFEVSSSELSDTEGDPLAGERANVPSARSEQRARVEERVCPCLSRWYFVAQ